MSFVVSFFIFSNNQKHTIVGLYNREEAAMNFSNLNRNEIVNKLKSVQYDLLIIGGGITGAGSVT